MQSIVQFNVDIANQRIPHILLDENKKMFRFGGREDGILI